MAVLVILALAISLGAATVIESLYDTQTAQFWIYRSLVFHLLLFLLGVNIACVAISRIPWKRRHIPFLLAHLGILILLAGSYLTEKIGLDGNLRISEGEQSHVVDIDENFFRIDDRKSEHPQIIPIQWQPPGTQFYPKEFLVFDQYKIRIDQFLSHADSNISFVPGHSSEKNPALHFRIKGGPMAISQDFWLWTGGPSWQTIQAGPAEFSLNQKVTPKKGAPQLFFSTEAGGGLSYQAISSDGKIEKGKISAKQLQGFSFRPGWKGNVEIQILEWLPDAIVSVNYSPSRIQYGPQASPSAIYVVADGNEGVWLGLGDRAVVDVGGHGVELAYYSKKIVLPFDVKLNRFTVEHDQGTLNPAAYFSNVTVTDGSIQKEAKISMNEPLEYKGYTLYQASYEDGDPRPVTSILAVNRDPGRVWKYLGSALIVLGSILLFARHYRQRRARE